MKNELQKSEAPPMNLLAVAVEKGASVEQLKQLMDLQERWEKKEAKKSFFEALSRFQTMVPEIKKTKTANITSSNGGRSYSYKFADLSTIAKAIKTPLNECGLSFRWEFEDKGTSLKATCYITHLDGHTESTSMESVFDNSGGKNSIQQKGSTQTYLQRYTLIGVLGLSTADEDKDGAGAPPARIQKPELTDEEIMDQWKQAVKDTTKISLNALYLKNKKTVDGDNRIQAIFKARESELKQSETNKTTLP